MQYLTGSALTRYSRNTTRRSFRKKKKQQQNQQLTSSCGVNGHALMHASENHADLHDVSIWLFSKGKDLLPKGKKQPMMLFHMSVWFSLHYYCGAPTCLLPPSGRNDSDLNFKWNYSDQNELVHQTFRPPVRAQRTTVLPSMPALSIKTSEFPPIYCDQTCYLSCCTITRIHHGVQV